MTLSIVLLVLAIACRTCSELSLHGKLRLSKHAGDFWSGDSWTRKYKTYENNGVDIVDAPNTWYYRFFKLKYKERWPTSATFTVFLTDGYHLCQSIFFITLAASLSIALPLNFFLVWGVILFVHSLTYRLLQR